VRSRERQRCERDPAFALISFLLCRPFSKWIRSQTPQRETSLRHEARPTYSKAIQFRAQASSHRRRNAIQRQFPALNYNCQPYPKLAKKTAPPNALPALDSRHSTDLQPGKAFKFRAARTRKKSYHRYKRAKRSCPWRCFLGGAWMIGFFWDGARRGLR